MVSDDQPDSVEETPVEPPQENPTINLEEQNKILNELNNRRGRELERLLEEKATASEIFSETIAKYECEIADLEATIAVLREGANHGLSSKNSVSNLSVPILRKKSPEEKKPFISVASSFVATLMGGGSQRNSTSRNDSNWKDSSSQASDENCSSSPPPSGNSTPVSVTPRDASVQLPTQALATFSSRRQSEATSETPKSGETKPTRNPSGAFWKGWIRPLATSSDPRVHFDSEAKQRQLHETWKHFLEDWESRKSSKQFLKYLTRGVPVDLRGEMWKKAIGNKLTISRPLYMKTVARLRVVRKYLWLASPRYRQRLESTLGLVDDEIDVCELPTCPDVPTCSTDVPDVPSCSPDASDIPKCFDSSGAGSEAELPFPLNTEFPSGPTELGQKELGQKELRQKELGQKSQDEIRHGCDLCSGLWDSSVVSAFETIAADLHRTLPRLGVVTAFCSDHGIEEKSDSDSRPAQDNFNSLPVPASPRMCASSESGVRPLPIGLPDGLQLYSRLRLLLESFAVFRPDICYVQGMGFIAAMLLLYIEDDYEVFVAFTNLMAYQSLAAFYSFDVPVVDIYFHSFDSLLTERLPLMSTALEEAQIPSSQFLVDWFYTLFTRCLPFDVLSRVWDLFLVQGDIVLFQVALGMLKHFQLEEISPPQDLPIPISDQLSTFVSSSSTVHFSTMHADRFLDICGSIALTKERLNRAMKQAEMNKEREKEGGREGGKEQGQEGKLSSLPSSQSLVQKLLLQHTAVRNVLPASDDVEIKYSQSQCDPVTDIRSNQTVRRHSTKTSVQKNSTKMPGVVWCNSDVERSQEDQLPTRRQSEMQWTPKAVSGSGVGTPVSADSFILSPGQFELSARRTPGSKHALSRKFSKLKHAMQSGLDSNSVTPRLPPLPTEIQTPPTGKLSSGSAPARQTSRDILSSEEKPVSQLTSSNHETAPALSKSASRRNVLRIFQGGGSGGKGSH